MTIKSGWTHNLATISLSIYSRVCLLILLLTNEFVWIEWPELTSVDTSDLLPLPLDPGCARSKRRLRMILTKWDRGSSLYNMLNSHRWELIIDHCYYLLSSWPWWRHFSLLLLARPKATLQLFAGVLGWVRHVEIKATCPGNTTQWNCLGSNLDAQ